MDTIALNNDLGHPICHNLRAGDWLIDYIVERLQNNVSTFELGKFLEILFEPLKKLPRYLVPCYFYFIIKKVYDQLIVFTLSLMSK